MASTSQDILLKAYFEKRVLLVRYFTRLIGEAGQAEDVVQDLYLKITAVQGDLDIQDATAFLFKMGHNVHLNRVRAQVSGRNRDNAWHELSRQQLSGDVIDDSPSPEAQTAGRQEMHALNTALQELPPRTQEIFRLHKLEGISQAEVASRLAISLSSVEKHLSSALKHLMGRLRGQSRDGPAP